MRSERLVHSACSESVTVNDGYSAAGGIADIKNQSGWLSGCKSIREVSYDTGLRNEDKKRTPTEHLMNQSTTPAFFRPQKPSPP